MLSAGYLSRYRNQIRASDLDKHDVKSVKNVDFYLSSLVECGSSGSYVVKSYRVEDMTGDELCKVGFDFPEKNAILKNHLPRSWRTALLGAQKAIWCDQMHCRSFLGGTSSKTLPRR